MPRIAGSSALSRLRILDLSRVRAGPTCVRQFADFGADVIKIETPPGVDPNKNMGGPRDGPDMQNLHRNKRALTLNLKLPASREVLERLGKTADGGGGNRPPDVKDRLGIDYESLAKINPRIILASISGFGQDGPYRDRPGFDQIAQGMGGLMSITGLPGQGAVRGGIPVAGFAATGILIALLEREVSGEGQWVRSSLLQAQIQLLDFQAARWLIGHEVPGQAGNDHPTSIPTGVFPTSDGHINIAAAGSHIYKRFCEAIGAPQLIDHPDYKTDKLRSQNRAGMNKAIADITRHKSSREWIDILNKAGVPCGPIYQMDEVFADEQVKHLRMAAPVHHPRLGDIEVVNQAVELSRTPSGVRYPTPDKGEHTDEILGDLGYDAGKIAELRKQKVV